MKLTISRSALAGLLTKGGTTVAKNSPIAILQHARLIAGDGTLRVSTTDLECQAEVEGAADVTQPGKTTVPAAKLKAIVDRLPPDATVSLSVEDGQMIVKAGRSRLKLPTLPAIDYPSLDATFAGDAASFTVTGAELERILARPSTCAGESRSNNFITDSIFLHVRRDWNDDHTMRLCGVGTNGAILVLAGIAEPEGAEGMTRFPDQAGVLLSKETVATALRLFKDAAEVTITVSPTRIRFDGARASLSSKLIDGRYPDYNRVLPKPSENLINLDRSAALKTVALVEVFATKDRGHGLVCGATDSGLALGADGAAAGEGVAVAEAEVFGQVECFGISAVYLRTMLDAFGSEIVTLSIAQVGSPVLAYSESETDTVGVIMPMNASTRVLEGLVA